MYLFDSQSVRIGYYNFFPSSSIPNIGGLRDSIGLGNIIALYEQQPVKTSGDSEEVLQHEEKVS